MANIHESLLYYHPNQYEVKYRIGEELLKFYKDSFGENTACVFDYKPRRSPIPFDKIWELIANRIRFSIKEDWLELHKIKLDNLEIMRRWGDIVNREMQLFIYTGSYFAKGKNIFDFSGNLSELFRYTDINDCPTEFNLPFNALYVYFGPQHDLCIQENYCIDGAYVVKDNQKLGIVLTTVSLNDTPEKQYNRTQSPDIFFQCKLDLTYENFGDAIDDALGREDPLRNAFESAYNPEAESLSDECKEIYQEINMKRNLFFLLNFNCFKNAISLVVNTLFYMDSYFSDIVEEYPESAPQEIVEKIKNIPPEKRKRLTQSLTKQGFSKIRYPIERFSRHQTEEQNTNLENSSDSQVTGKWVKGHNKQQAHGKGWSERRNIWIKPYNLRSAVRRGQPRIRMYQNWC
jgi:hypothetical protein